MAYGIFAGWGEETTWGTAVARTQFAKVYSESQAMHDKPMEPVAFLGNRDPDRPFFGPERGTAELVLPWVYTGLGKLFKHALGITVDAGAGPYTHTHSLDAKPYTRTSSPLKGLTVELNGELPDAGPLEAWLLTGGRVLRMAGGVRAGEENRITVGLQGKEITQVIKSGSPTFPNLDTEWVIPQQVLLTIDGGAHDIYGFDWELNNGLREDKAFIGSQFRSPAPVSGKRSITGTIDKEWVSKALWDKMKAGTTAALLATATAGARIQTIRLANVRFGAFMPPLQEGEDMQHQLPWTAFDDATYGAMQIIETNATATT